MASRVGKIQISSLLWLGVGMVLGSGIFWFWFSVVGWSTAQGGHASEWVTAGGTVALAIVTLSLVVVGAWQISDVRRNQRTWTSLQACDRYDLEPMIVSARDTVRNAERDIADNPEIQFDKSRQREIAGAARRVLNFFDAIAIGIRQELYLGELVKAHLENIIKGNLEDIIKCGKKIPEIKADLNEFTVSYEDLDRMLKEWKIQRDR
jgi:hypothetical protein